MIEAQQRLHITPETGIDLMLLEVLSPCLRVQVGYFKKQLLKIFHRGVDPIGENLDLEPTIPRLRVEAPLIHWTCRSCVHGASPRIDAAIPPLYLAGKDDKSSKAFGI
jgi:hypothetical protein